MSFVSGIDVFGHVDSVVLNEFFWQIFASEVTSDCRGRCAASLSYLRLPRYDLSE
jgi:hypothetical protein